jgi:formylglycine-generating enzyme required for sulfatase activity
LRETQTSNGRFRKKVKTLISISDRRGMPGFLVWILLLIISCAPLKTAVAQAAKPKTQAKKSVAAGSLQTMAVIVPGTAVKIEMVRVPAGTVSITTEDGKGPARKVAVRSFWIAKTETTWEAFDGFMMSGPAATRDDPMPAPDAIARPSKSYIPPDLGWGHHGYPVINESLLSAEKFCLWLSKETGRKFRLPTEAEWEYACRAGKPGGAPLTRSELDRIAWYDGNSGGQTHPVGKKQPNAWGLYDMLGNAGEWAVALDGKPVLCGGSYDDKADKIKPGRRARQTPDWQATDPQFPKSKWWLADGPFVGFRIVCE